MKRRASSLWPQWQEDGSRAEYAPQAPTVSPT
jgi:hypothetical protein